MLAATVPRPHTAAAWPLAVLCVALWWLASPYDGIRHDAVLYAGDALRRLNPGAFARDIFFHQGSQGDFSIFGALYAALIGAMGAEPAAHIVTVTGRALWLAALLAWVRTVAPGAGWVLLLAAALCLPSEYGPLSVLNRAEAFATPRIYAEAASLLALTLALRSRWWLAAASWAAAMAMHPLMGIFAGVVLCCFLPPRRPVLALALVALALACAWAHQAGLLVRLGQSFDDAWFAVVEGRNPMILWDSWTAAQFSQALLALVTLLDARRRLPPGDALRRMAQGLAGLTMLCLALWFWASESRNVLILQVQPWRVLWLTLLLAPLCWLAAALRTDRLQPMPTALLFFAWTTPHWPAAAVGLLALGLQAMPQAWAAPSRRRLVSLLVLGLAAIAVADVADRTLWLDVPAPAGDLNWAVSVAAVLKQPLIMAGVLALAWVALSRRLVRWVPGVAAAGALLFAALAWSSTAPPPNFGAVERDLAERARSHIPAGACIWSELGLASTWLHLQRCAYASNTQGSGAQFDRGLALTLRARLERLQSLGVSREGWRFHHEEGSFVRTADVGSARLACEDRALDWLVFKGSIPTAHVVIEVTHSAGRLSLFDCNLLRDDA